MSSPLAIRLYSEGHCGNEGEPDAERMGGSHYQDRRPLWPDSLKPC